MRYEMIETIIPANAVGAVPFPDVPNLRNQTDQSITVLDLEFFPIYVYGASFLNNTVTGTPVAEIPKIAIVLYVNGEESIRRIPLAKINYTEPPTGTAAPFQHERVSFDKLRNVDWPKSYFQYNAAGAGAAYVLPIGVTYLKFKPGSNQPIQ